MVFADALGRVSVQPLDDGCLVSLPFGLGVVQFSIILKHPGAFVIERPPIVPIPFAFLFIFLGNMGNMGNRCRKVFVFCGFPPLPFA